MICENDLIETLVWTNNCSYENKPKRGLFIGFTINLTDGRDGVGNWDGEHSVPCGRKMGAE